MGSVTTRTSQTSRGIHVLSPVNGAVSDYSLTTINLGSNSISKLEVVSSLNSFNIAHAMYYYHYAYTSKYNPKLYLGSAIQTTSSDWNNDYDSARQNLLGGVEKSGSF